MRQTLHIFRKDARCCWPYIAAAMAATAANACLGFTGLPESLQFTNTRVNLTFTPLVLAWWLAIGAAVHRESPIGDRQFWTTRPYSWKSLFAAKLLFLAAFLGLPMLLSDCTILLASGFNPLPPIPGLLVRQCWLAAFLVLPFTVAVLTRSTGDFVLAGLAYYIGAGIVFGFSVSRPAPELDIQPSGVWGAAPWLLPVAGLSLVLWQYARRRTIFVRMLAIPLAALAAVWLTPSLLSVRTPPYLPVDSGYPDVSLRFDPGRGHPYPGGRRGWICIPVELTGWPHDMVTYHHSAIGWVDSPTVPTPWGDLGNLGITTGPDGRDWLILNAYTRKLPPDAFDLSLPLFLKLYERQGSASLRPGGDWAYVHGFGSVRWSAGNYYGGGDRLIARTALKPPGDECAYGVGDGIGDFRWEPKLLIPASPLTFRFNPVYSSYGYFRRSDPRANRVLFTAARRVAIIERELKIPQIRLADYQVKPR